MQTVEDVWYDELVAIKPFALNGRGYAIIRVRGCPMAWSDGRLARCRYVAWAMGWLTDREMVVHHRNFDKLDDHPSNLEVLTREKHAVFHDKLNTGKKRTGEALENIRRGVKERDQAAITAKARATALRQFASGERTVVISDEQKEKIRRALLGKKHTPERRENIRLAHLGIKPSEETRRRQSESQRARRLREGWASKRQAQRSSEKSGARP